MSKCNCCEKDTSDRREGICFDCANFESLVHEGFDMYDKPIEKLEGMENYSHSMSIVKSIMIYARKRK